MKTTDHHPARRFGHVYRFLDDLIPMNDNEKLQTSSTEKYPAETRS